MQRFQYQYGDKPLEGYTIQRGVGRGGFGEVYYAISDSGKQVALKTLQTYEQIELRGINQCMNLKSPYLVTIFDVKYNAEGKPFVIMEYVSGPSLADIIRESPGGLGPQKTAFFLREISKGLSYLHGCGIVHRDLKPGNIFYEDGRVKIGDYGLSKSMNTSVHSGQTITVGTVHYMAPEIGAGCYNRSIDIYAMGVVVYEMLTGQVPFFGNSPAEVLMKHMSSQPDLAGIDETFARMIRRAMAKDPAERYSTVQEMVEDVFGSEHIRNSVSQFRPESLSIIAENLAKKITPQPGQAPIPGETPGSAPKPASGASGSHPAGVGKSAGAALRSETVNDPLDRKQRTILAVLAAVMVSIGTGMLSGHRFMMMPHTAMMIGMILVGAKLIMIARWKWLENLEDESGWLRHLLIAAIAAVPITMFINMINEKGGTWLAIAIGFGVTDWWKLTSSNREQRVSLGQAFGSGLVGFIAAAIFNGQEAMAAGVVAGTCLVVQIWSAFSMTNSARVKFEQVQNIQDPLKRAAAMAAQAVNASDANPAAQAGQVIAEAFNQAQPLTQTPESSSMQAQGRLRVPGFVRFLWLIVFVLMIAVGIGALVAGSSSHRDEPLIGVGVGCIWLGLLAFLRVFAGHITSWYDYLIRPIIMSACLMGCIIGGIMLGQSRRGEEVFLSMMFMVGGGLGFLVCFIPLSVFAGPKKPTTDIPQSKVQPGLYSSPVVSPFKRVWALVLAGGMIFGFCGLHRFYVGKIGTGILWLLTMGLFGIGQLIDILMIIFGGFRDKDGRKLLMWESEEEMKDILRSQPEAAIPMPQPAAAPAPAVYAQPIQPARTPGVQPQAPAIQPQAALSGTHKVSIAELPFNIVRGIFGLIAALLCLTAILVGLATVLHLPQIVAGGFPDPSLAQEMADHFGRPDWAGMLEQAGFVLFTLLLIIATTVTLFVRRHDGAIHILRALAGNFGLWMVFRLLNGCLPVLDANLLNSVKQGQPFGPILENLLHPAEPMVLMVAVAVFLISMAVLAWPPKKKVVAAFPQAYGV